MLFWAPVKASSQERDVDASRREVRDKENVGLPRRKFGRVDLPSSRICNISIIVLCIFITSYEKMAQIFSW